MTDPERAAFVEWFTDQQDEQGYCPWAETIAELAAQAVEKAVLAAGRACSNLHGPIPWRAAMADSTTGTTGDSDRRSESEAIAAARLDAAKRLLAEIRQRLDKMTKYDRAVDAEDEFDEIIAALDDDSALAAIVAPKEVE